MPSEFEEPAEREPAEPIVDELPRIQWYPGHIAKAQRVLQERLQVVDVVIEVADARVPLSSRFQEAKGLIRGKPSLLVLTKPDLADPQATAAWARHLGAIVVEARTGKGVAEVKKALAQHKQAIDARMKKKGRLPRAARVMVVGLPNVGKSSLINRLAGGRKAPTGDKPGVTRAPGWIRLTSDLELLDTPGLIPPRLDDRLLALKLAMVGAVSDEAYDPVEVARAALAMLAARAPAALAPYGGLAGLEAIAVKMGWLSAGGPDLPRAARTVLHDLRSGALGRLCWDTPPSRPRVAPSTEPEPARQEAEQAD